MIEAGELGEILHIHLEMPQESFYGRPKVWIILPGGERSIRYSHGMS